jgi:YidC/Oxa1 family membrane protein insertase
MFNYLYQTIAYQPILNILVFLYNNTADLGIAIILLTVIIKLVLWPLSRKAIKSQKELQEIQPKLDELKKKYADNKTELGKATMDLYKEYNINPFSSCLPMLIQLPFLFAVFRVLRVGLNQDLSLVYSFLSKPTNFQAISLGLIDLSKPNIYLAILAGAVQFIQAKMMLAKKQKQTPGVKPTSDESMTEIMNKQMVYIFPVMTVIFGISLPGGLTLYWFMFTLFTVIQQYIVLKKEKNIPGPIEGEIIK